MSFFDFFKSRESREKLSHLKNLLAVAFADGKLEKTEVAALAMVMARDGLTPSDFERCVENPESIKFLPPKSPEQRIVYLRDMVLLMMCDGDIDDRELAICKATAIALGFKHEVIDAMIMDIISDIKSNSNFVDDEKPKKRSRDLSILYFYMNSKMTENQDALLRETPLELPVKRVNLDEDEVLQKKYDIRVWPVFILVDPDGKELHRWQGLTKGEKINEYIDNL